MGASGELAVVRHEQDRLALGVQPPEQLEHLVRRHGVEVAVGSSPTINLGSAASERAIATRCCSPPESSAGRWSSLSPSPTSRGCGAPARSAPLRAAARRSSGRTMRSRRRERRQQLEEREDDPDVGPPPDRELLLAQLVDAPSVDGDRPGRRPVDAVIMFRIVDLPLTAPAATSSPAAIEVHAAQRAVVDLPHPVDLLDAGSSISGGMARSLSVPVRASSSRSADIIVPSFDHARSPEPASRPSGQALIRSRSTTEAHLRSGSRAATRVPPPARLGASDPPRASTRSTRPRRPSPRGRPRPRRRRRPRPAVPPRRRSP